MRMTRWSNKRLISINIKKEQWGPMDTFSAKNLYNLLFQLVTTNHNALQGWLFLLSTGTLIYSNIVRTIMLYSLSRRHTEVMASKYLWSVHYVSATISRAKHISFDTHNTPGSWACFILICTDEKTKAEAMTTSLGSGRSGIWTKEA